MSPLISVLHPTKRLSGARWRPSVMDWFKNRTMPETASIEYILCVDEGDTDEDGLLALHQAIPFENKKVVINRGPVNSVSAYNTCAAASTGVILVNNMDDLFSPVGWDLDLWNVLLEDLRTRGKIWTSAIRHEAVIHCSSGSPRDHELFIPQIMTRARYEKLGYFFHPEYRTAYGDDDLSAHARLDKVVIEARGVVFRHLHPGIDAHADKWFWDECYSAENRPEDYQWGLYLYTKRKAAGFPPLQK